MGLFVIAMIVSLILGISMALDDYDDAINFYKHTEKCRRRPTTLSEED